ncbi:GSCFA domain-containing protein [Aquimarina sp. W85]|uniref:GSCFA domain-containing protein n=1 Tax=Aquimarina rhodophyticola TaxID=3342246 RepID=UPI00366F0729
MNLQTKISLYPQDPKIDYNKNIMALGSCFADNIGERFAYYKFQALVNPFGILFHPKAIETFLWMTTQDERYVATDLFNFNDRWHCFDAHSKVTSTSQDELLEILNSKLIESKAHLQKSTHIFITLGTAWVYRLKAMDMIVANCHKIPQKEFDKELLSVEEVEQCIQNCLHFIRSVNPQCNIIFTVSPVRHSKDGFVENNRSKAHLLTAIHNVVSQEERVNYFPAYEIVMDELRDYRFYKPDMLHPTETAIQYVWERFMEVWIDEKTLITMGKIEEIQRGIAHRPFQPNSKQHQIFLQNLEEKKRLLKQEFSFLSF